MTRRASLLCGQTRTKPELFLVLHTPLLEPQRATPFPFPLFCSPGCISLCYCVVRTLPSP